MLPPLRRFPGIERLVAQRGYFVIHAPRQTGKTTAMLALADRLTMSEDYTAVMVSVEVAAAFIDDVGAAENAMLGSWRDSAESQLPEELHPTQWTHAAPGQREPSALTDWPERTQRPLDFFLDEIDVLRNETLIAVLRQLRAGYPLRPKSFPQSLALIGVRDVRDYKVASGGSDRLGTASPFNIKIGLFRNSRVCPLHLVVCCS